MEIYRISYLFQNVMKTVESNYIQSPQIFKIFNDLKKELVYRKEKLFFGFEVNQEIKKLNYSDRYILEQEGVQIYTRMLSYLEKWFDFSENSFYFVCSPFNLNEQITLEQACKVANLFGIVFDGDQLFSEIRILNEVLPLLTGSNCTEKWIEYFKINTNAPELIKLCKFVFAVPANNCFVERIFSVMGNIWTNERNRLHTDMVKSELFMHFNYKMSCTEFANFIKQKNDSNKKLIEAAKSNKKYKYKALH